MSIFGDFLKHKRKEQNMTMNEVIEVVGISQPSLSHYEKGTKIPTYSTLRKLADLYGMSHEELIKRSEDMHIEEAVKPIEEGAIHRFKCVNDHVFYLRINVGNSIEDLVSLFNAIQCPICHCGGKDIKFNMRDKPISE